MSGRASERLGIACASRSRNEFLCGYVEEKLRLCWTPARIAGRLRREFGEYYDRNLCAETIYEWIYCDDAPADLRTLLPRKRRQRGQCERRGKRAGVGKIPQRIGIEDRPEVVETRGEAGHFEGDTVAGKQRGAAVNTEVERQSRYMIARIIPNKAADQTLAAMLAIFREIPEQLRKTLTLDQRHRVRQAHGTARSHHHVLRSPLRLLGARIEREHQRLPAAFLSEGHRLRPSNTSLTRLGARLVLGCSIASARGAVPAAWMPRLKSGRSLRGLARRAVSSSLW